MHPSYGHGVQRNPIRGPLAGRPGGRSCGQADCDPSALALLALQTHLTSAGRDDPTGYRKAKARSFFLRSKEQVQDLVKMLRRNAISRIPDFDSHPRPRRVCWFRIGPDCEGATAGHGLDGIQQDVEEELLHLLGVDEDLKGPGPVVPGHLDPSIGHLPRPEEDGLLDDRLDDHLLPGGGISIDHLQVLPNW